MQNSLNIVKKIKGMRSVIFLFWIITSHRGVCDCRKLTNKKNGVKITFKVLNLSICFPALFTDRVMLNNSTFGTCKTL